MQVLRKPLRRQQSISRTTKMRIYNAAVLSVLLYGAETWPLTGTLSSRLDGFDSRALRSILGIHWRDLVSDKTVRALAGQPPASSLASRRRVRWYGHVLRLSPHHPSRAILDFDPGSFGWKRPWGAPRTRWFDVIKRDLDKLGLDPAAVEPLAQDRDKWRALVNMVGSTHNVPTGAVHETRWWWWWFQDFMKKLEPATDNCWLYSDKYSGAFWTDNVFLLVGDLGQINQYFFVEVIFYAPLTLFNSNIFWIMFTTTSW